MQVPRCHCLKGFTGLYCETNINDCIGDAPCKNNGTCIDEINDFTCNCEGTGYTGKYCTDDIDECQLGIADCGQGTCENLNGSYKCICQPEYCGFHCNMENQCKNVSVINYKIEKLLILNCIKFDILS